MNQHVPEPLRDVKATKPLSTETVTPEKIDAYIKHLDARTQDAPGAAQPDRVEIQPDPPLMQDSLNDAIMTEALVDQKAVEVTDEDRTVFLKAVLNEEPVHMTIALFNGQMKVECRSRYSHEQIRIFDTLRSDIEQGLIAKDDPGLYSTRFQDYVLALTVTRINGVLFSEIVLPPDSDSKTDIAKLRDFVQKKLANMSAIRRTAILNALRIFETKCAKLSTEVANEDFWKPRG